MPPYRADEIEAVLFLLGDAGEMAAKPTIEALDRAVGEALAAVDADRVAVVFLGDNVYPSGIEIPSEHDAGAHVLRMQLAPLSERGVRLYLVPGNHDSDQGRSFERVDHQRELARSYGAKLLPDPTCSGPDFEKMPGPVRIGFLDLQHVILSRDKESACTTSHEYIRDNIEAALPEESEWLVIAAHHPLRSGGRYSGYFTLREQFYPQLFVGAWAHQLGASSNALRYPTYARVRHEVEPLLAGKRVIWVAGHEHNFQYFDSPYPHVISGGSRPSHTDALRAVPGLSLCSLEAGFTRIDFVRDGAPRLAYVNTEGTELLSTFVRVAR